MFFIEQSQVVVHLDFIRKTVKETMGKKVNVTRPIKIQTNGNLTKPTVLRWNGLSQTWDIM